MSDDALRLWVYVSVGEHTEGEYIYPIVVRH
jgi:hypothetical protein